MRLHLLEGRRRIVDGLDLGKELGVLQLASIDDQLFVVCRDSTLWHTFAALAVRSGDMLKRWLEAIFVLTRVLRVRRSVHRSPNPYRLTWHTRHRPGRWASCRLELTRAVAQGPALCCLRS